MLCAMTFLPNLAKDQLDLASDRDFKHLWNSANVSFVFFHFYHFAFIESPDPGIYDLKSDFDLGKPSTAGTAKGGSKRGVYSMGVGRHIYQKVYLPEDPRHAADFTH